MACLPLISSVRSHSLLKNGLPYIKNITEDSLIALTEPFANDAVDRDFKSEEEKQKIAELKFNASAMKRQQKSQSKKAVKSSSRSSASAPAPALSAPSEENPD